MPTTFIGLAIFVAFLVPGFIQSVQRQRRLPTPKLSTLAETTAIITTSLVTGTLALGLFALARVLAGEHTPDVRRLVQEGGDYAYPRLGYIGGWAVAVFAVSCGAAFVIGLQPRWLRRVSARVTPVIVNTSIWYQVLKHDTPPGATVYVGCDLRDGSYVAGNLDWFSTQIEETGDRDLTLATPITVKVAGQAVESEFARVVVSARDIVRLYVTYVSPRTEPEDQPGGMD